MYGSTLGQKIAGLKERLDEHIQDPDVSNNPQRETSINEEFEGYMDKHKKKSIKQLKEHMKKHYGQTEIKTALKLSDEFALTRDEKSRLRKKGITKKEDFSKYEETQTKNIRDKRYSKTPIKPAAYIPLKYREAMIDCPKIKLETLKSLVAGHEKDEMDEGEKYMNEGMFPIKKKKRAPSFQIIPKGEYAPGKKY